MSHTLTQEQIRSPFVGILILFALLVSLVWFAACNNYHTEPTSVTITPQGDTITAHYLNGVLTYSDTVWHKDTTHK